MDVETVENSLHQCKRSRIVVLRERERDCSLERERERETRGPGDEEQIRGVGSTSPRDDTDSGPDETKESTCDLLWRRLTRQISLNTIEEVLEFD